jgi:hypothetical protein
MGEAFCVKLPRSAKMHMTGGQKRPTMEKTWCNKSIPKGTKLIPPALEVLKKGGSDIHKYCLNCIDALQFEDWVTQAQFAFIPEVAEHIAEPHLKQRLLRDSGINRYSGRGKAPKKPKKVVPEPKKEEEVLDKPKTYKDIVKKMFDEYGKLKDVK